MATADNIYQTPAKKLGDLDANTQAQEQHPWLAALGDFKGAGDFNVGTGDFSGGGLQNYAYGNTSLADAVKSAKGNNGALNSIFTNPMSATKAASDQVQSNPMFSGMFGAGGIQDQRQAAETNLMNRGYSLQPEDNEAYGQASDNIARQFGQTENSLSQALASHGLAAGGSGAATAAYSGVMGNKNEQLAQSQRQIANDRMSMNLQRLTAMQGAVNQGNSLAQGALNSQRDANQKGVQMYQNQNQQALDVGNSINAANTANYQQDQATKFNPGAILGGVVSAGLGAATGGLGTAVGAGLGKSLFSPSQPQGANYYAGNEASPGFVGPRKQ